MDTEEALSRAEPALERRGVSIERIVLAVPHVFVPMFAMPFLAFAMLYAVSAMIEFVRPIVDNGDIVAGLAKGLHMGVVALPVYELAQIVYQEYDAEKPDDAVQRIHRGVTRFASVVFVALILESLILVIKYSQQDLAGLLFYPVAIIVSAAVLLVSLGAFIRLTGGVPGRPDMARAEVPQRDPRPRA